MNAGYDDGYKACPCFWGKKPGSLVKKLSLKLGSLSNFKVLDVGCGEGKNAIFMAERDAQIIAIDISKPALKNAVNLWPHCPNIMWHQADIRYFSLDCGPFDIVILYGVLHCLSSYQEIIKVVERLKSATTPFGYHIVCTFNNREQNLTPHPGLNPILISHNDYLKLYQNWQIFNASDSDLWEVHPHNNIYHMHSMTRFIASKRM